MKWLDLYPNVLSSTSLSEPVEQSSNIVQSSDGPYAELLLDPSLIPELDSIPLYAWLLPANKVPLKYNSLFSKYGIPLLK